MQSYPHTKGVSSGRLPPREWSRWRPGSQGTGSPSGADSGAGAIRAQQAHTKLTNVLTQVDQIEGRQLSLAAEKQEMSQQLKVLVVEGRKIAAFLKAGVRDHYGRRAEKLTEYSLQPFRGMCCGVVNDLLVLRLGEDGAAEALAEPYTRLMDFTGKPMKSMVYVTPDGSKTDEALREWVHRAVSYASSLPARP